MGPELTEALEKGDHTGVEATMEPGEVEGKISGGEEIKGRDFRGRKGRVARYLCTTVESGTWEGLTGRLLGVFNLLDFRSRAHWSESVSLELKA